VTGTSVGVGGIGVASGVSVGVATVGGGVKVGYRAGV